MTRSDIATLKDRLITRDYDVLDSVDTYRLLTSRHIQRLCFNHTHPTPMAATRACHRTLVRLRDLGVLKTLQRRIGGAQAGSAGFVWYVGPAGEHLLRERQSLQSGGRRNYREPSRHFVDHTLAVAELAVQTIETARTGAIEVLSVETEPGNWRQSLSKHGTLQWLKPDLHIVTATADEEIHAFIEADLATEHLPVILRQCAAYETYRATGRYQAEHGLFPTVLWVTPDQARASGIRGAIEAAAANGGLELDLFYVCIADEYTAWLTGDDHEHEQRGGQEGGHSHEPRTHQLHQHAIAAPSRRGISRRV